MEIKTFSTNDVKYIAADIMKAMTESHPLNTPYRVDLVNIDDLVESKHIREVINQLGKEFMILPHHIEIVYDHETHSLVAQNSEYYLTEEDIFEYHPEFHDSDVALETVSGINAGCVLHGNKKVKEALNSGRYPLSSQRYKKVSQKYLREAYKFIQDECRDIALAEEASSELVYMLNILYEDEETVQEKLEYYIEKYTTLR